MVNLEYLVWVGEPIEISVLQKEIGSRRRDAQNLIPSLSINPSLRGGLGIARW